LVILVLSGCATPVGVSFLDLQASNRKLTENVLADGSLSAPTQQLLNRAGLSQQYGKEPAAAIENLRTALPTASKADRFFALSELSFLHASKGGERSHYLAAAVYAYAFLFPGGGEPQPSPFDSRPITAVNLFNQGLALGLAGAAPGQVDLKTGDTTYSLPFGEIVIHLDPGEMRWGHFAMADFVAAAQLEVRGLRNDYRWPGIGSSLVASLKHIDGEEDWAFSLVPDALKVSVTALLRIDDLDGLLGAGNLKGELVLYTTQEETAVEIGGRRVPLEYRPSTALAFTLEGSQVYRMELRGLLSGDLMLFKQAARFRDNVFLMSPYRPGLIPLVLVHGTASSPARWAEVINEIINDHDLRDRYQIWLFTYNTGNPVLYSGGLLVQGLKNLVLQMDPEGKEEALRKMVIVGHSQGGLLTKLTAIDSGTVFWDNLFTLPPDQLNVTPESRAKLEQSLFFKPLPFVRHVVFISTPHRGSKVLSRNWIRNLLQRVISLPFKLLSTIQEIYEYDSSVFKVAGMRDVIPRSTDNMHPGSRFVKVFSSIPLSPTVQAHSIIAVNNPQDPREEWSDGVVTYQSAHIEGVQSELIVHSGHSAQDNPEAIEEIRRILVENLNHQ
jgi:pimeloyl-ACP methyl ester carboxylesterase